MVSTHVMSIGKLTEREKEVLRLMAEGESNKTIGKKLHITEKTVKSHASTIFDKLGAFNRAEATAIAFRSGLIQ